MDERLRALSELAAKFKNDFDELKRIQNNLSDENKKLTKENDRLSKDNEKLTKELDEIKSSTLWKIKSKF